MSGAPFMTLENPAFICESIIDFIASGRLISVFWCPHLNTWVLPAACLFLQSTERINELKL